MGFRWLLQVVLMTATWLYSVDAMCVQLESIAVYVAANASTTYLNMT